MTQKYITALLLTKYMLKRAWYISMFSIPLEDTEYVKAVDGKWVAIINGEDYPLGRTVDKSPLNMYEKVVLPKGSMKILNMDIKTDVGVIIINYVLFEHGLRGNALYVNSMFTYNSIAYEVVESKLKEVRENPTDLLVDDYRRIARSVAFLRSLSKIIVVSSTEDTMYPPDSFFTYRDDYRKALYKEDKYWYRDTFKMLEYESNMVKYIKEIYKDDPSLGITFDKKAIGSFMKKYVGMGIAQAMQESQEVENSPTSLTEGHRLTRLSIATGANNIRYGSSARAFSTVIAGVIVKQILLATHGILISEDDCGTKKTLPVTLTSHMTKPLSNVSVTYGGKTYLGNSKDLEPLVGKAVEVRTAMGCKVKGENLCKRCVGLSIARNPKGVAQYFTMLAGTNMNYQLGKFHGSSYEAKTFEMAELFP